MTTPTPVALLEEHLANPHSKELRQKFFRIRAGINSLDEARPWIEAAADLRERGVIDDDGFVYFAAIFLEDLTYGDTISDPELQRIQREIDALDAVERAQASEDDEYDEAGSPEMQVLFRAFDARAHAVTAEYLRELGYPELGEEVTRDFAAFIDRTEVGASKLFDEDWGTRNY
jgi:hypothetical protein